MVEQEVMLGERHFQITNVTYALHFYSKPWALQLITIRHTTTGRARSPNPGEWVVGLTSSSLCLVTAVIAYFVYKTTQAISFKIRAATTAGRQGQQDSLIVTLGRWESLMGELDGRAWSTHQIYKDSSPPVTVENPSLVC